MKRVFSHILLLAAVMFTACEKRFGSDSTYRNHFRKRVHQCC
jgi:Zinc-finger double-stranded RNA-binding.